MSFADKIRDSAADWIAADLIDPAQADRIVAFERGREQHSAPQSAGPTVRGRMQALFGVLGGLLVGLGVLLTVATNWDEISDPVKVVIVVGSMICAYAIAMLGDAKGAPRWASSVAFVVGVGVFGGGLLILGDVYSVDVHPPLAALLVGLAATAMTVLAERPVLGWIASAAGLGWLVWELIHRLDRLPEERLAGALISSVICVSITGIALSIALEGASRNAGAQGSSGWRVLVTRGALFDLPLRSVSLLIMLMVLIQSSFAWHWDWDLGPSAPRFEQWIAFGVAGLACGLMLRIGASAHTRVLAAVLLGTGALGMATAWIHEPYLTAVVSSVVVAAGGVGLVLLGMVETKADMFIWGILWLAALVITRYLDFVFAVDLGGPGFIGAGLVLIGIAWGVGRSRRLWSNREEVVG